MIDRHHPDCRAVAAVAEPTCTCGLATDRDLLQRAAEALRSAREYMLLYHQKCSAVCAEAATENYDKVLAAIEARLKETA